LGFQVGYSKYSIAVQSKVVKQQFKGRIIFTAHGPLDVD